MVLDKFLLEIKKYEVALLFVEIQIKKKETKF